MEKVLLAIMAASGKSQEHVTGTSLTVMLAGVCAVSSATQRRFFHFVYEPKSWKEAQLHCRALHQDLASVDGEEHVKAIMACMDPCQMPVGDQHAWIGRHGDRLDWTWSGSGRRLHKSRDFQGWSPGEPNNWMSKEDCVEMYNNGHWNDWDCKSPRHAVCVGRTGAHFLLEKPQTWTQARADCKKKYLDLAEVTSSEVNERIKAILPSGKNAWIGLSRVTGLTGSGNRSCLVVDLKDAVQWKDWNCDSKHAFICYEDVELTLSQLVRVRVVWKNSSVDLSDAAVMESILKQLEERLQRNATKQNVKLSWDRQWDGKVFREKTNWTLN
ncbi:macrophage mannose receptor 1-like isoform X2 [Nerophis ophidion]|uniref:macrophage mannose receptor 1-like isoform X2 n=1 Tax=Nerophis ophidion TaxID=159077 RepID=UPI002ADF95B5|nr:macrophage mannose receptor 1-like isoform X2 [Nerophis ophidion]